MKVRWRAACQKVPFRFVTDAVAPAAAARPALLRGRTLAPRAGGPAMRSLLAAALLAASAAPSAAQAVHGRVLERGTDRPVPSATVELRVGTEVRAQARTLDDGSFMLVVPGAGTYRVATARMGYESLLTG